MKLAVHWLQRAWERFFKLIELLVVMAIVAILAGMLLPALADMGAYFCPSSTNMLADFVFDNFPTDENYRAQAAKQPADLKQAADAKPVRSTQVSAASHSRAAALAVQDEQNDPAGERRIVVGKPETVAFQALTKGGERHPVLRFRAWFPSTSPAGWNPFLTVELNGKPIPRFTESGAPRLLNRNLLFGTGHWGTRHLWQADGKVVTFFTNDPEKIDPDVMDAAQKNEGCWFAIDLTGLIAPAEAPAITFKAVDIAPKNYGAATLEDVPVMIDRVGFGWVDAQALAEMQRPAFHPVAFEPVRKFTWGDVTLETDAAGALRISRRKQTALVASQFSIPEGKWLTMGAWPGMPSSEAPAAVGPGEGGAAVVCAGGPLRVERKITVKGDTLFFEDGYTNISGAPIGVIAKTAFNIDAPIQELRLGGNTSVGPVTLGAPGTLAANPTLFWGAEEGSVGVMVLDTVFRAHLRARGDGNTGEMWTENLEVKPGATVALRWRLNLFDDRSYWAFVNRLRRDLGLNFTIEGPLMNQWDISDANGGPRPNNWWCSSPRFNRLSPEALQDFARMPVHLMILSPWFEYYDGLDWTREKFKEEFDKSREIIKRFFPDSQLLGAVEIQLESVRRDEAAKVPWADSIRRDEAGNFLLDGWWHVKQEEGYTYAQTYISLDNQHFQRVQDRIRYILDDLKLDGVYFDLWNIAGITYDRGDGFSCLIDPATHAMQKEVCFVAIIAGPAQRKLVDDILRRGRKTIVANCSYGVEELTGCPINTFIEWTVLQDVTRAEHHLMSPLVFTPPLFFTNSRRVFQDIRAAVEGGLLPYIAHMRLVGDDTAAYDVLRKLFPFTPVEIRPGVLMGRERLVTTEPGNYLWLRGEHANRAPEIFIFDENAQHLPGLGRVEETGADYRLDLSDLPRGTLAIVIGK